MCMHACKGHECVHVSFSVMKIISRIGDFDKKDPNSQKKARNHLAPLIRSVYLVVLGGSVILTFLFGALFFQKIAFLDFWNFQNF